MKETYSKLGYCRHKFLFKKNGAHLKITLTKQWLSGVL